MEFIWKHYHYHCALYSIIDLITVYTMFIVHSSQNIFLGDFCEAERLVSFSSFKNDSAPWSQMIELLWYILYAS